MSPLRSRTGRPVLSALAGVLAFGSVGCARVASVDVPPPPAFQTVLGADNPLVGLIIDADNALLTPKALIARLTGANAIILGEQHDNPDHHRLQVWVYRSLIAQGRRPALVLEMIDEPQQAVVDAWVASGSKDTDALRDALDWAASGWPDWEYYAPLIAIAAEAGLPIRAGDLAPPTIRALYRDGAAVALGAERAARLGLDRPMADDLLAMLTQDVRVGHCDLLPRDRLPAMAAIQHARDAVLADNLAKAVADADGAILIAGNGHARRTVAVPRLWSRISADAPPLAVSFREIPEDTTASGAFSASTDVIWFTPRANDFDHCADLRSRMTRAAAN